MFYIDCLQYGGAERVMANLCNLMADRMFDVVLINDIHSDETKKEYSIDKRVNRFFLDDGNIKNGFFKKVKIIRQYIKKEKPDAVIAFLGPPNYRAILASIGLKTKIIVSVRNDPTKEYGVGIKKIIANILFSFADGIVFQTKEASLYFSSLIRKRSAIIFNPVAQKFYSVLWNGKNKEIAVVGRLQRQKNPLLALKAFNLIQCDFPDYKIVFYGDDELKKDIIDKSVEYGIEDKVIIFGKAVDIEKRLADSKLFLLSSDFEGMPNSLLEAMAVGVPVVSTNCPCGGPRFIIQNENQGELVECNNAFSMANAIKGLLSDPKKMEKMSIFERERALDFKEDKVVDSWITFIDKVVNK